MIKLFSKLIRQAKSPAKESARKEYIVVLDVFSPDHLASKVNKRIAEGWECVGGVSCVQQYDNSYSSGYKKDSYSLEYLQAMSRVKG